MKKRIISLILAVVMLAMSLVGCAYSYENERLEKYVESFDSDKFEAILKSLEIEDGEFSEADPEKREKMVVDALYSLLATNATNKDKKDTGKPGDHDMFYYSYYITMEVDVKDKDGNVTGTKTVQFAPDYMTTAGKGSLQLGMNIYSSTLQEKLNDAAEDYEFKSDKAYSKVTLSSTKAEKGQLVAISYKYSYKAEGDEKVTVGAVSYQLVVLDENNPLHKELIGYKVNTEYKKITKGEDGKDVTESTIVIPKDSAFVIQGAPVNEEITLSEIKMNYIAKGELFAEIEDVTYEEEPKTALKDIYGSELKVKDAKLTYHVYAYRYSAVDELNSTNIIKLLYGKNLTKDTLKDIIEFGAELKDKTDDERKDYFDKFSVTGFEADEDSTVFDTLADKLVKALKEYDTKKSELSTAETALSTAETKYNEAKNDLEDNPSSEAAKEELEAATKEKESKEKAVAEAQTALEEAEELRDELISALVTRDYKTITDAKAAHEAAEKAEAEAKKKYDDAKTAVDEANKESAHEKAEENEKAKKTAYEKAEEDEAKKKTEAEKEGATEEAKTAYETAKTATKTAKEAYDAAVAATKTAKEALDAAQAETKDEKEAWEAAKKATEDAYDKYKNPVKYLTPDSDAEKVYEEQNAIIIDGYKDLKYKELQDEYRAEIKEKVAIAVFVAINEQVKVNSYPKKAVDEAYDKIMNDYKYDFYNGNAKVNGSTIKDAEGNTRTNYNYYLDKGGFNGYLVEQVKADYSSSVTNASEAKEAIRAWAQDKVEPVLKYSYIAQYYDWKWDLVYEDYEFKEYKKDKNNGYESDEYTYGESTVRNGLQFEKIMDFFTASKEVVDDSDPDGKFIRDEYKNVKIVFTEE